MSLKEYKPGATFPGVIGRTVSESEPAWPQPLPAAGGQELYQRLVNVTELKD